MQLQTRSGLGITLALLGGLLISIDIPVIRLSESDPWFYMVARGLGLTLVLGLAVKFGSRFTETPKNPFNDRDFVEIGILYGISSIFFTLSVFNTSTSNLVFILAFNPMLAALFAWWFIGEKPSRVTWIAIFATITGVVIIVSDGIESGNFFGDFTSLVTAAVLALSLVRTRKTGKDLSLSGSVGGLLSALFALPLALSFSSFPGAPGWVLLNALVLVPIAGFCLTLAPRYIPAPQVAIFFLLETVLAPIWVWLIFSEIPSQNTLIGGLIVLLAIAGHSFWQLKEGSNTNIKQQIEV